jgi:Tfp pilus assembly protein PilX
MLTKPLPLRSAARPPSRERGAVMLIALILLVVLTLAGLALVRSVSTSNVIAGNLAFRQAATHSADAGVEAAIAFLAANSAGAALQANVPASGYVALRQDPAAGQSWDAYWNATLAAAAVTLPADVAGNTVSYVIHRLCNATGAATYPGCSASPVDTGSAGNSHGAGVLQLTSPRQIYYRITARVTGPRNTLSYVQAVVAQ